MMLRKVLIAILSCTAMVLSSVFTLVATSGEAEARSFSSGARSSSFSSRSYSSRSYSAPKPARNYSKPTPPKVVKETKVIERNRTTVIERQAPASSGIGSSIASGMATGVGAGVGLAATSAIINGLSSDNSTPSTSATPAPQETPEKPMCIETEKGTFCSINGEWVEALKK